MARAILIQIFRPPSFHPCHTGRVQRFPTVFTKHRLPGTPVNRPGNARSLSDLFATPFFEAKRENTQAIAFTRTLNSDERGQ